jgi:four helix bundle protein
MKEKIRTFMDLDTWKEGHKLLLMTYGISNNFPHKEVYSLTSQMRRCAVSITSNIAEGFSRRTQKEKSQFYYVALGSITELQNQLIVASDLNYIEKEKFNDLIMQLTTVQKLTNGLIKSVKILTT